MHINEHESIYIVGKPLMSHTQVDLPRIFDPSTMYQGRNGPPTVIVQEYKETPM